MLEALAVLLSVALLAALGLVAPLLPPVWVVVAGAGAALLGLLVGVPTGFWYHVRLRASLAARGELPPRWWLRPARLHPRLRGEERSDVLRWYYAGGAGFALTLLGCAVVVLGVALQLLAMRA